MPEESWLVFIDTNILLDFYRLPGSGVQRQLEALKRHKNSLILSDQVRMEFLKNRQKAIIDWLKSLSEPKVPQVPPIIADYHPVQTMRNQIVEARKAYKKIQLKLDNILHNPKKDDPVYKELEILFGHNSPINLVSNKTVRTAIVERAVQRFTLGYPPRKSNDTSIGDAVNWEWLVHCAKESEGKPNTMIVSRDRDFGSFKGKIILNDWLRNEFYERVGSSRNIELTNKLTTALGLLDEQVSPEDLLAEEELLSSDSKYGRPSAFGPSSSSNNDSNEDLQRFLSNWKSIDG